MKSIEARMLLSANLVAVQSEAELTYFRHRFGFYGNGNPVVLKNGVSDEFFRPRLGADIDLLFVGTLDDNYRPTVHWFIEKVYARFAEPRPRFVLVGSLANENDHAVFEKYQIEHVAFVDDISAYYRRSRILVAPIFKGFGTITKVLEGMAAGCIVIGDRTAFNGIVEFVPGRDGLIAESEDDFFSQIRAAIDDDDLLRQIGTSASELMKRDFSWHSRWDDFSVFLPSGHESGLK